MNKQDQSLRIVFAGTPDFAVPALQALIDTGFDVMAVLTQPDRPAGRGKKLRASPVKQLALQNGLRVWQPDSLRGASWQEKVVELGADLMVVVAYGLMIPPRLLAAPRLGCWNIHASLLPRWRGAAPMQRAIEAGDEQTGVCIMQIEAALDSGPVYHELKTPIGRLDTGGSLHDRLAEMGAQALLECLDMAASGMLPAPRSQDESLATYAHKLSKAEAELDWSLPAEVLARRVRAFNPWPVAWCELAGQRLRVWQAEVVEGPGDYQAGQLICDRRSIMVGTSDKLLKINEIQRAGGQKMATEQFLLSNPFQHA